MSEAFDILNEEGIISIELTHELIKMVGLRNILTRYYEKLDHEIVYNVLQNGEKDIKAFLNEIEEKLNLK